MRVPGHMFVGYYTDRMHKNIHFLETSMIGDVNLDDFFPEEKLDSTVAGNRRKVFPGLCLTSRRNMLPVSIKKMKN